MLTNLVAWSRAEQFTRGKDLQPVNSSQKTGHRKPDHVLDDGLLLQTPFPSLLKWGHCNNLATKLSQSPGSPRHVATSGRKQTETERTQEPMERTSGMSWHHRLLAKALEQRGRGVEIDAEKQKPSRKAPDEHKADRKAAEGDRKSLESLDRKIAKQVLRQGTCRVAEGSTARPRTKEKEESPSEMQQRPPTGQS